MNKKSFLPVLLFLLSANLLSAQQPVKTKSGIKKATTATPCMDILELFTAPNVPEFGPDETPALAGVSSGPNSGTLGAVNSSSISMHGVAVVAFFIPLLVFTGCWAERRFAESKNNNTGRKLFLFIVSIGWLAYYFTEH